MNLALVHDGFASLLTIRPNTAHLADLTAGSPSWPESTRRISQLRIALEYEPRAFWKRQLGLTRLNIDIVDYPGEWLLDLPLLGKSYEQWSAETLAYLRQTTRPPLP
mgnify:CR=1 FL=1